MQALAIGVSAVVAFALGYVGMRQFYPPPNSWTAVDYAYEAFRNFWMWSPQNPDVSTPATLAVARFMAPLVTLYAGVSAVVALFSDRFASWWRIRAARGHTVLCGLGQKGSTIVARLHELGERVVCIEIDETAEGVSVCRERGIPVIIADAADPVVLARAGLDRADNVIVATGDDGTNALVALRSRQVVSGRSGEPLVVLAHVVDPRLCDLLRERFTASRSDSAHVRFFNLFDGASAAVLNVASAFPWDAHGSSEDPAAVLLVGDGPLAQRLPLHLAKRWQIASGGSVALPVIAISAEAEQVATDLLAANPGLDSLCDIRPVSGDPTSTRCLREAAGMGVSPSLVLVFGASDGEVIKGALTAAQQLPDARVLACLESDDTGLAALLCSSGRDLEEARLASFPLLQGLQDPQLLFGGMKEALARQIHENYVAERTAQGLTAEELPALVEWDSLTADDREQNLSQASDVLRKLDRIGCEVTPIADWDASAFCFGDGELDLLAREEHDRWRSLRARQGWTFGEERDDSRKVHPCMVEYDELPSHERDKDREAVAQIPRLLASVGYRPRRMHA